jgi:hypothetical protein
VIRGGGLSGDIGRHRRKDKVTQKNAAMGKAATAAATSLFDRRRI